jgi:excisionase family DNA binding protein
MGDLQELLTVSEAGAMLRLKESTIRSWILKKKIPYVKLGRRVFVRQSDAQNTIESSVIYPDAKASAH